MSDEIEVSLNRKAYEKLNWAKKKDESFSDVVVRLVSTKLDGLQRRGEKEILTSDEKKLELRIDQSRCMGAESCVALAPEVFALDESSLGTGRRSEEPLAMREVMDKTVASETIIRAAQSCPYKAIFVRDLETGEEIFPE